MGHGAQKEQQISGIVKKTKQNKKEQIKEKAWNPRRGSCKLRMWVEGLEYSDANWSMQYMKLS